MTTINSIEQKIAADNEQLKRRQEAAAAAAKIEIEITGARIVGFRNRASVTLNKLLALATILDNALDDIDAVENQELDLDTVRRIGGQCLDISGKHGAIFTAVDQAVTDEIVAAYEAEFADEDADVVPEQTDGATEANEARPAIVQIGNVLRNLKVDDIIIGCPCPACADRRDREAAA